MVAKRQLDIVPKEDVKPLETSELLKLKVTLVERREMLVKEKEQRLAQANAEIGAYNGRLQQIDEMLNLIAFQIEAPKP